jgi:hypothetical protein
MKKALIFVPFLFLSLTISLAAQRFEDRGFRVEGRTMEGQNTVYRLQDSSGAPLTVVMQGEPDAVKIRIVDTVAAMFRAMKYMSLSSLRIIFFSDRTEIIALPRSFSYQGKDLNRYLPSGLQFYYIDYFEYDFRMVVENLFLRLKGQYFTEEQFAEKLANAAANPFLYIQSQDPEYIIRRFQEIDRVLEKIGVEGTELSKGIAALKKEGVESLGDVTKSLEAANRSIETLGRTLSNEIKEIKDGVEALTKTTETQQKSMEARFEILESEFILLRYALMVLNNRGFFGSINLPAQDGIVKLVEMKKRNPALTMKEAEVRLKAEGIQMSSKEVFLVFSIYFNEFQ